MEIPISEINDFPDHPYQVRDDESMNELVESINVMAKTQNEMQKRMKILEKVISLGYKTEEDIKKLMPKDLLKDESLSFTDLLLIYDLQESVKNNRLFSFLSDGASEVV